MEKLVIEGGVSLEGEVHASGSKNSALPILAACLLTDEPITLHRIPRVRDIRTMEKLMTHIGVDADEGAERPASHSMRQPGRIRRRRTIW